MSLRRKHYPNDGRFERPTSHIAGVGDAQGAGVLLDEMVESIICQVCDPFATFVDPNNYHDVMVLDTEGCLNSMVAGVAEALGLPSGLSFEDVFARIV